ncbi:hypothetical protein ABZ502_16890 [Streptomyces abikoensis]|uniref:hypothetical protein n=1 Tax=Streptomyces abikoensis TaxID=97398 RepID=UPI0033D4AC9B
MPAPRTAVRAVSPLPSWLKFGVRALDGACGEVGVVTGIGQPYMVDEEPAVVYLRPERGGTEWQCAIADLTPAPPAARSESR